jgi:hypothetical protein
MGHYSRIGRHRITARRFHRVGHAIAYSRNLADQPPPGQPCVGNFPHPFPLFSRKPLRFLSFDFQAKHHACQALRFAWTDGINSNFIQLLVA